MDERSKKIQSFNVLVHKLPIANFELLRHLSSFLIEVVDNAQSNKMTVRNVGIVFAPTLNIPAPLIAFFLTDFLDIFGSPLDEASSPIHEIRVNNNHLGDDAIRSPRRQMFSDLPTPAYNETNASIDDHLNSRIAFLHHRTQRRSLHSSSNINRSEAAMAATIPVSSRCGQAMTPLSMSKLTRTVTATEV
jgi:hypothetical protein